MKRDESYSLKKVLNLEKDFKIVILPAGIRRIKDINYVLENIFKMYDLKYFNHYFFIIGSILD